LEDDGLCGAGAILMPWGDKEKVLAAMHEHIDGIKSEGVTEQEFEKVKNQHLRDEVTESLTVSSKAMLLGEYETLQGGAEKVNQRLDEIRALTRDDLKRVANVYLVKERETTGIVEPKIGGMFKSLLGLGGKDDVDEGAAKIEKPETNRVATRGGCRTDIARPDWYPEKPPMGPLLADFPAVEHHRLELDNGLSVVVVPNHEAPFVTVRLGILNGAWTEDKPGTASMAAGMVTKGSENHTAAEMAEELEYNAININGSANMDTTMVSASCVTDKFDLAAKLLAEVAFTPTFPKSEFEVQRQQVQLGLMVQSQMAEYAAERQLRRRMFGAHPYARTATGEMEDVQALTAEDLQSWWRHFVRPQSATLYIAGDVKPDEAFSVAKAYFGGWQNETPMPEVKMASVPEPKPTHIYLVDRPGSVQSQIRVGHPGITRRDEGYYSSRVLSQIFGGAFNSRLNKAIRVEKGLTYGARGGLTPDRFVGQFNASTFTKTPSTAEAVQVILDEIDRIRTTPPEKEEVDMAKAYLAGSFAGDREIPQATVSDLWMIESEDLPADYLQRYLAGVKETTAENVLKDAKRFIDRDHLVIVVVGEASQVKDDLAKIAPVTEVPASGVEAAKPTEVE